MLRSHVTYRANKSGLDDLLRGRNGPVVLHQANKGREAAGAARRRVGVKTGKLKASIDSRLVPSIGRGYNVEVFASAPYAQFHHDGTKGPYPIVPKSPGGVLVFQVGGVTVFTRRVMHPGVRANRFLLEACREVGLNVRRR